MKVRPRFADILLALGLVALVVWTPTYFAQSTEERALLDGDRFWLRDFHDGDRMDLELLVSWPDGTSYSTGPIVRVAYATPGPDAPPGAVLEERRTFERGHMDLRGVTMTVEASDRTSWYDADGVQLWANATGIGRGAISSPSFQHGSWPDTPPLDDASVHREGDWGTWDRLWQNRSQPLWYDRVSDLRSVLDIFQPEPSASDDETPDASSVAVGSIEDQYRIHAVYKHGDHSLYAANLQESSWGPYPAPPLERGVVGHYAFPVGVQFEHGIPRDGGIRHWDWYARDFPTKVGLHQEFFDPEGEPHVALDLVPNSLLTGDQPIGEPAPAELDDATPTIPLRSWQHDTTPILNGVSAAAIAARLQSEAAPTEVRDFMAAGGWLGGIAWFAEVAGDGRAVADVEWVVLVVDDASRTHVVGLRSDASGAWATPSAVRSLCGAERLALQGHEFRIACTPVDLDTESSRQFFAPAAWPEMPTLPPGQLAQAGLRHVMDASAQERDRASLMVSLVPGFGAKVEIPPERGHGQTLQEPITLADREALFVLTTNERRWTATTWFDDEALVRSEAADWTVPPSELAAAQPRVQAARAEPMERTDLVGQTVGYGAALLLAAGFLLRLVAGLKTGIHLPVAAALYAKVTKDATLDNERRQHLVALVADDPGVALADLAREAGLHRTVAFHHLDTLRRHGLLSEVRLGRTRHYVPTHVGAGDRVRSAALHHDAWRDVLNELERVPGASVTEIARRLGRDKSRVSRVARRLEGLGLVRREGSGPAVALFAVATGNDLGGAPKAESPAADVS